MNLILISVYILFFLLNLIYSYFNFVLWVNLGSLVLPVVVCKVTKFKSQYNFLSRVCAVIGYTKRRSLQEGFSVINNIAKELWVMVVIILTRKTKSAGFSVSRHIFCVVLR